MKKKQKCQSQKLKDEELGNDYRDRNSEISRGNNQENKQTEIVKRGTIKEK